MNLYRKVLINLFVFLYRSKIVTKRVSKIKKKDIYLSSKLQIRIKQPFQL